MDLATLIGLIGGVGVMVAAILTGGSPGLFVDLASCLIVGGGTIAATLIRFPLKTCFGAFRVALKAFRFRVESPLTIIKQSVELAAIVRREGLLALESQKVDNPFLAKGLRLCVDGLEPEFVRKLLTEDMEKTVERHESGQAIFKAVGEAGPAMGMLGTLIGLVQMLANMDDPKAIGPAMAVALLTTFYGSAIANLMALPIADKLSVRTQEEALNKTLIIESIASIQEGRNPRLMEELLMSFLPGSMQAEKTEG
ncbi:MAG: MotA/TolQ/ExbB proton channel family protein [Deltaproteobacteria bacterium]|nr:MotA/TolQ/ExbB proton channel family protein [Deltaproteobacteria bacterium]MCB9787799.1 MotA/TolQ/ExbB proton channel family protein [Deltaproteobacteria bacterium]